MPLHTTTRNNVDGHDDHGHDGEDKAVAGVVVIVVVDADLAVKVDVAVMVLMEEGFDDSARLRVCRRCGQDWTRPECRAQPAKPDTPR